MIIRFARCDDERLAGMACEYWRARAARMRFRLGQMQELVAGGLLMEMTGFCEPKIALSASGKPFFADHPSVHFNISHSFEYVLCAIADHPVGCDIERDVPLDDELKKAIGSIANWTLQEASFKCGTPHAHARLIDAPCGYLAAIAV